MIRIRTNEGQRKCIQLTWKGVEYALKVINAKKTVFEVSEESFKKKKKKNGQKGIVVAGCSIAFLLIHRLKGVTF